MRVELRSGKARIGRLSAVLAIIFMAGCATATKPAANATATETAAGSSSAAPAGPEVASNTQPEVVDFTKIDQKSCPKQADSFPEWVGHFEAYALHRGQKKELIASAFAAVKENPDVAEKAGEQPEFVTPVWGYLEKAVSDDRVTRGKEMYIANQAAVKAASQRYGVDVATLMGIWGIETNFGSNFGDVNVFEALSNVGYGAKRADFACEQLMAALQIAGSGKIPIDEMVGSWAGAMGHSQFLPSKYLELAVDADGSGAPDLWTSMPDVFASTANHLIHGGWTPGLIWGLEVKLPKKFPYAQADLDTKNPIGHWRKLGVKTVDGKALPALTGDTSILVPAGSKGPAFLITENFRAILKYNYSTSYALSVAYLGQRVLGGTGIKGAWPVGEPLLSLDEREELQTLLAVRGYDVGKIDGVLGLKSRKAARQFQKLIGWPQDGFLNKALLEELRKHSES